VSCSYHWLGFDGVDLGQLFFCCSGNGSGGRGSCCFWWLGLGNRSGDAATTGCLGSGCEDFAGLGAGKTVDSEAGFGNNRWD